MRSQLPQYPLYPSYRFLNLPSGIVDFRLYEDICNKPVKEEIGKCQESADIYIQTFYVSDIIQLIPESHQVTLRVFNVLVCIADLHVLHYPGNCIAAEDIQQPPVSRTSELLVSFPETR